MNRDSATHLKPQERDIFYLSMFPRIPCAVELHEVLSDPSGYPWQPKWHLSLVGAAIPVSLCVEGNLLVCSGAEFRPDCGSATKADYNRLWEYSAPLPKRVCQWVSSIYGDRGKEHEAGAAGRPGARQGWDAEWDFQTLNQTEERRKQARFLVNQTLEVRVPTSRVKPSLSN